jgi:hypothetical protein
MLQVLLEDRRLFRRSSDGDDPLEATQDANESITNRVTLSGAKLLLGKHCCRDGAKMTAGRSQYEGVPDGILIF